MYGDPEASFVGNIGGCFYLRIKKMLRSTEIVGAAGSCEYLDPVRTRSDTLTRFLRKLGN